MQFASEGIGTHCHIFLTFQVASRGLCQTCGTELQVQFLSNAPIAVINNRNNKSNKASLGLYKSKARKNE